MKELSYEDFKQYFESRLITMKVDQNLNIHFEIDPSVYDRLEGDEREETSCSIFVLCDSYNEMRKKMDFIVTAIGGYNIFSYIDLRNNRLTTAHTTVTFFTSSHEMLKVMREDHLPDAIWSHPELSFDKEFGEKYNIEFWRESVYPLYKFIVDREEKYTHD